MEEKEKEKENKEGVVYGTGFTNCGGGFFQEGHPNAANISYACEGTYLGFPKLLKKEVRKNNPYIPLEIHVDVSKQVMVVKWQDGTETKVTCDSQDNFSIDVGFGMAFTEYMFGGKTQFKEKWWKIIQRRIKYH
jgi:hypothetical protein